MTRKPNYSPLLQVLIGIREIMINVLVIPQTQIKLLMVYQLSVKCQIDLQSMTNGESSKSCVS